MQRVFIYTNLSSSTPSAVLTLKGKVTPSSDRSGDYPRSRGNLLLRRDTITLAGDKPQTERIACLNNGSRAMRLEMDDFSSKGLTLRTEPAVLAPGKEGDLVITYTPEADGKKPLWLKLYTEFFFIYQYFQCGLRAGFFRFCRVFIILEKTNNLLI